MPASSAGTAADPARSQPRVAVAPRRVGRFELCRVLGSGAQATAWLAFDPRLEREVALKLLSAATDSDEQDVTHWLGEARSVARLTHPNIVPVFEADVDDGRPYLVFEYVPGRTLTEHLRARGGTLPPHEALALALDVLAALAAAHAGGVIHRDLKPSNVLIDGDGRARVMDFGIAARSRDGSPGGVAGSRAGDVGAGPGGSPGRQSGSRGDSDAAAERLIVGTPAYMSPEAARGTAPTPAMDVFSTGMLLIELLSGRPLPIDRDPLRALRRRAGGDDDLALPAELPSTVDDALRGILRAAIAREPAQRTPTAAALADALRAWMVPSAAAGDGAPGGGGHGAAAPRNSGTLDFLLRRMRHKSDFPALSDSVANILRIATSDNESLASLTSEILKDVALTHKLLRLVNTAHFGHGADGTHSGDGAVSTVSRAVALVGFAGIRNMALSLLLIEHMHDKGHAERLKEEFVRALMAGSLASALCNGGRGASRDGEEAFVAAMFQNLGRLLTEFYFAEEAGQIRSLAAASLRDPAALARATAVTPAAKADAEAAASISVLGLSFDELGHGIARSWHLPDPLLRGMRRPDGAPPPRVPGAPVERMRWLARAANELTDALLHDDGPGEAAAAMRLSAVAERHAPAIGRSTVEIRAATQAARERLAQLAQAMKLQLAAGAPARRLLAGPAGAADRTTPAAASAGAALAGATPQRGPATGDTPGPQGQQAPASAYEATLVEQPPARAQQPAARREQASDVLSAGIADVTQTLVDAYKLNDVLRMILETMYRALGFRRVIFCLRDARTSTLTGRFGLGEAADRVAAHFKIRLGGNAGAPTDLFAAVCAKGVDTLISDATGASIAARLPAWYRGAVAAPAFLLLPLTLKGATFALIYADYADQPDAAAGGVRLGEKELSLLRALRNQAVIAFRQKGEG